MPDPDDKTIVISFSELARLMLTSGETAYDRCKAGQSWEQTADEITSALIRVVRPLTDEEADRLLRS